jgi:hypothetical protein
MRQIRACVEAYSRHVVIAFGVHMGRNLCAAVTTARTGTAHSAQRTAIRRTNQASVGEGK